MAMKPKAKPGKDYMKPVGGAKQPGYMAPGSVLKGTKRSSPGYSVGSSAQSSGTKTVMQKIKAYAPVAKRPDQKYLKTGINPTAMKATSGNPKPTNAQMTAGKKATATAKANAATKAKAKAAADKAAKLKAATTAKKPTTGVYKRNQG
jgi:hypothetical protein